MSAASPRKYYGILDWAIPLPIACPLLVNNFTLKIFTKLNHVTYVILLDKRNCHTLLVVVKHQINLSYSTLIFGVLSLLLVFMATNFFLTVVDDFTRFTWVILLKSKSEVRNSIKNFVIFAENQFNTKVKFIRSDNGAGFIMPEFYLSRGIIHQTSVLRPISKMGGSRENINIS